MDSGSVMYELARWDASIATFMLVQNCLGMQVIDKCGTEEQKKRILPDAIQFKKILSFAMTEPAQGSDGKGLMTTAKKSPDGKGWVINGQKRWISFAGIADYIMVMARNADEGNKLQGFLVEKGTKGLKTEKIENKYALRMLLK